MKARAGKSSSAARVGLRCCASVALLLPVLVCTMAERDRTLPGGGGRLRTFKNYWVDGFPFLPALGAVNTLNRWASRDVTPSLDVDYYFPAGRQIEAKAGGIIADAHRILRKVDELKSFGDVDDRYKDIAGDGKWKVYILKWYDDWIPEHVKWAPNTYEAVKDIEEVKIVMFSILPPGVGVPAHTGPYCGSIRYHLGLIIPEEGEVFISVGGQKLRWEAGKGLLIDDTFEHYVVNNSTGYRVVLFMDVVRKVEYAPVQWVNKAVADSPVTKKFFEDYSKKTELQKDVCCGAGCLAEISFCPNSSHT